MRCKNCEAIIDEDATFCTNCGSNIKKLSEESLEDLKIFHIKCKHCEAIIDEDTIFCPNCGSNIKILSENSLEALKVSPINPLESTQRCKNCEAIIEEDMIFCPNCGSNIKILSEESEEIFRTSSPYCSGFSYLGEDSGTRGSKKNIRTVFFYGKARYGHEMTHVIERFFISKNLETKIIKANNELIIQGNNKSTTLVDNLLCISQSVSVGVSIEGNNIIVTIDSGVALDLEIEKEIEKFLSSKEREDYARKRI